MPIRISGQDCRRGTFFHRSPMLRNQDTPPHIPLRHPKGQPNFTVIDSVLSEEASLATSMATPLPGSPRRWTIWEAHPVISRTAPRWPSTSSSSAGSRGACIAASDALLPYGYEGQGPEHCRHGWSATCNFAPSTTSRSAADHTGADLPFVAPTDAAPVPAPAGGDVAKSLLRHPPTSSGFTTHGRFEPVIDEVDRSNAEADPGRARHVPAAGVLRPAAGTANVRLERRGIVRVEQLYRSRATTSDAIVAAFPERRAVRVVSGRTENQGAWGSDQAIASHPAGWRARADPRRPALGCGARHRQHHQVDQEEQEKLVDDALTGRCDPSMNRKDATNVDRKYAYPHCRNQSAMPRY